MDCIEEGIVTEVLPGSEAIVTATRAEACASCSSQGTCVAMGGSTVATTVRATNEIGARQGDRVAVRLAGSAVVSAAGLLYFLPAVALVTGAWGGHEFASSRGVDVNLGAAIGAGAALAAAVPVIALIGRRLGRRQRFVPRIAQVLLEGGEPVGPRGEGEPAER